jgi:hypothetical protein
MSTESTPLLLNRSVWGVTNDEARSTRTRTWSILLHIQGTSPVPVVEEDRRVLLANYLASITLPDGTTQALGSAARDAFAIFKDLSLLSDRERPQYL